MNKYKVSYVVESHAQYNGSQPHNNISFSLDDLVEADSEQDAIELAVLNLQDRVDNWSFLPENDKQDGFIALSDDEQDYQYYINFSAKLIEIDEVNVIMADHKTEAEAKKHLKNGTIVYDVTEEGWPEEYQQQENATLDEIKTGNAGSLTYLEYEGHEFVISYVL